MLSSRLGRLVAVGSAVFGVALLGFAMPAKGDQLILDDLIVDGSACIGFDCVNGEAFGFDTLRLKENNLRINFQDTSNSASFPSNDWRITANDSSNGGDNKFSIDDVNGGRTPFTIRAGTTSNSLYVDSAGDLGLGTNNPVVDLHVVSGNTPTLRLEQNGSSGFTPQTWDVAGNEAGFFVRDATNGSTLPFRILPGASSQALVISGDDEIGIGAGTNPASKFHIENTGGQDTDDFGVHSDGSVTIGTMDPASQRLRVAGGVIAIDNNSGYNAYDVGGVSRTIISMNAVDVVQITNNSGGDGGNISLRSQAGGVETLRCETDGDVVIAGNLSKGGGSFKIDHPLDPENKYLYHSFVESPDMMNIYNGVVRLDENGAATVELPEWFSALNREFRYQLTAIGGASPNLHVAEEVASNCFKVAGGAPDSRVSWQLTGVRKDPYAEKHRIKVEELKPENERGLYLHPEAYGQPVTRGVNWSDSASAARN